MRKHFLALALAAATAMTTAALADAPMKTLRDAAQSRDLLIGAAIMSHALDTPAHADLIAKNFNSLTGENEFKPDQLQREKGKFTFANADKIAAFAKKHDMKLVGHTLLWHNQAPKWMFTGDDGKPLPREQALENLKSHIDTVVRHFKGQIIGWDVVNEAISDNPNEYLRDTPAKRAIGDDYLIEAFKLAKAADPDVELYYNDYSIEAPGKRDKTIRLIKDLQSAGVTVEAVGIQGHFLLNSPPPQIVDDAIRAFAALGVKVHITELDVDPLPRRAGSGADLSATERAAANPYKDGYPQDAQQKLAQRYAELFTVFAAHPKTVTRVTLWGTHDGTSWLNNWPVRGRTNHPLLWDRDLNPKPALNAILQSLQSPPAR